jgi:hypothetical protein
VHVSFLKRLTPSFVQFADPGVAAVACPLAFPPNLIEDQFYDYGAGTGIITVSGASLMFFLFLTVIISSDCDR